MGEGFKLIWNCNDICASLRKPDGEELQWSDFFKIILTTLFSPALYNVWMATGAIILASLYTIFLLPESNTKKTGKLSWAHLNVMNSVHLILSNRLMIILAIMVFVGQSPLPPSPLWNAMLEPIPLTRHI